MNHLNVKPSTNQILCAIWVILCVAVGWLYFVSHPIEYRMYNTGGVTYERATVVDILEEQLEPSSDGRMLGQQTALVSMRSGQFKGEELEVKSYLSTSHNIPIAVGDQIILYQATAGSSAVIQVYGYDHTLDYLLCGLIFLVLMALVGGRKGVKSVGGMVFSGYFLYTFFIPYLCSGGSPIWGALLYGAVSASVCLLLLNGIGQKTMTALLATIIGLGAAAICYGLISGILGINGYHTDEIETLLIVSDATGLQVKGILFSGILISALGAIMDMTMSITTALYELERTNSHLTPKDIRNAGLEMGRDMAGTMVETLVFAFVGTALITLMLLWVTGSSGTQLVHSNFMASEILSAVVGSSSVVLTVPIAIGCYLATRGLKLVD